MSPKKEPPRGATLLIDAQALDRILAKVGQRFVPANLDRVALQRGIERAVKEKEIFDRVRPGARSRAIRSDAKSTREALESLHRLLSKNSDLDELMTQSEPSIFDDIVRWIATAYFIEQRLNLSEDIRKRYRRFPTPSEWVAGIELPLIFEEFFHRTEARSRSGPTVRFVSAIMAEIGTPFAEASIIRAMTRLTEARNARRAIRKTARF
jgi:hypothetical protein